MKRLPVTAHQPADAVEDRDRYYPELKAKTRRHLM